ncbi:MAG: nucleotidyltransferase domain-containing protein [Saccharolobus sp.]
MENKNNILFKTLVGSRLFGLETEKSDYDYFYCYVENSKDILLGRTNGKGIFNHGKTDESWHEIGNVINGLKKGNINFYIGVYGKVINTSVWHKKIIDILDHFPTKNIYYSIHGMVTSNYEKYILPSNKFFVNKEKRLRLMITFLELGTEYLETGKFVFNGNKEYLELSEKELLKIYKEKLKEFETAYNTSKLHETSEEKNKLLDDILYNIRLENLNKETH